jgi:hypothetical protein
VEEIGLRELVLLAMYSNERHKFRNKLYLSGAQVQVGGGTCGGVRALWMPRLFGLMLVVSEFDGDSGRTFDFLCNKSSATFIKLIINT